jgi:hypothetical protein
MRNGVCVLARAVVVVVLGIASLSITGSSHVPPGKPGKLHPDA